MSFQMKPAMSRLFFRLVRMRKGRWALARKGSESTEVRRRSIPMRHAPACPRPFLAWHTRTHPTANLVNLFYKRKEKEKTYLRLTIFSLTNLQSVDSRLATSALRLSIFRQAKRVRANLPKSLCGNIKNDVRGFRVSAPWPRKNTFRSGIFKWICRTRRLVRRLQTSCSHATSAL